MELEVAAKLAPIPTSGRLSGPGTATATGAGMGHPAGTIELEIPGSAGAATSRTGCSSHVGARSARCTRRRRGVRARGVHPQGSTPWSGRWHRRDQQERGEPAVQRSRRSVRAFRGAGSTSTATRTSGSTPSREGPRGGRILQMAILVAIAVNERGEREIWAGESARARPARLDRGSCARSSPRPVRRAPRHQRRPCRAAGSDPLDPPRRDLAALPDHTMRDVLATCPRRRRAWSRRLPGRSGPSPTPSRRHAQLGRIAEHLGSSFPKAAQDAARGRGRRPRVHRHAPEHWSKIWSPTRSNGSTVSSPGATTWSGSSPTATRSSASTAHCSPSSTTSG